MLRSTHCKEIGGGPTRAMKIMQENAGFLTRREVACILSAHTGAGTKDEETIKYLVCEYCKGAGDTDAARTQLRQAGLFEFEVYQLLDVCPRSLLTLQLIIDEMEERYSQRELENILEVFKVQDPC